MTILKIIVLAALALPVLAHDMWIEASDFRPRAGATGAIVALKLRVGQDMLGDPLARSAELIKDFSVEDAEGRRAVVGREGGDPAGLIRVAKPGGAVVLYASNPSRSEQTAIKFESYLKEEGLEAAAGERRRLGQAGAVREHFSRCAKAVLAVDGAPAADRRMGCALELIADGSPYGAHALTVRLTYNDKPLAGALVVAMNRANPELKQHARTDAKGRAQFQVGTGGLWMIKAVHMVRAAAGLDVDWASYWASLTFERPADKAAASGGH